MAMQPQVPPLPPPRPTCNSCQTLKCAPNGPCTCVDNPREWLSGQLKPAFYVTHIVYAVPGRSSTLQYQQGDTVGSTTTITDSFKQGSSVSANFSGFLGIGGGVRYSMGSDWGNTNVSSTDVSATMTTALRKAGQVDGIDHDDDEIWFVVNPVINLSVSPKNSCFSETKTTWSFAQASFIPFYLTVGELTGRRKIEQGVLDALNSWGIYNGGAYPAFPELLKAHPFPDGLKTDAPIDPTRFQLVGTFPYKPVGAPGYQPTVQTLILQRKTTTTNTKTQDVSYRTSLGVTMGFDFEWFVKIHAVLGMDDTWSWTHSASLRTSKDSSIQNTVTIGQPAFGYSGPTVLRVYEDRIYKTYLTKLDSR
jgi:hypothetical protein